MSRFPRRGAFPQRTNEPRINQRIRVPEVRLIDEDGTQLGVVSRDEALERARERDLDLVEVSPTADPPVCKVMDYGRFKYEASKKEKDNKKKQHVIHIKEIRMRPKISQHDFDFKARNARKFIEGGDKVKATVLFRGRENAYPEHGLRIIKRLEEDLEDVAKLESQPRKEGRMMSALFIKK